MTFPPSNSVGTGNGHARGADGRFANGNRFAKGNAVNRRAQLIRTEMLRASSREDIRTIVHQVIDKAKGGDLAFIREWMDRTAGKPIQQDLLQRVEALEQTLAARRRT